LNSLQTASLLELDDNPHLKTSTRHVMVGITRSKVTRLFLKEVSIENIHQIFIEFLDKDTTGAG